MTNLVALGEAVIGGMLAIVGFFYILRCHRRIHPIPAENDPNEMVFTRPYIAAKSGCNLRRVGHRRRFLHPKMPLHNSCREWSKWNKNGKLILSDPRCQCQDEQSSRQAPSLTIRPMPRTSMEQKPDHLDLEEPILVQKTDEHVVEDNQDIDNSQQTSGGNLATKNSLFQLLFQQLPISMQVEVIQRCWQCIVGCIG